MLNVAVTGNVAAGKSRVVRWFARWGAIVIDSDSLVREVQQPGTATWDAIVRRFGSGVLRADETLDRAALRRRVLSDHDALAALNSIVHPAVGRLRAKRVAQAAARGTRILVNDIPLLFEVLDPKEFDLVVLVDAPLEVRRQRLLRRGLTPEEAERLMAAQDPTHRKRALSDIVIDNEGSLEDLRTAARAAWDRICERAGN